MRRRDPSHRWPGSSNASHVLRRSEHPAEPRTPLGPQGAAALCAKFSTSLLPRSSGSAAGPGWMASAGAMARGARRAGVLLRPSGPLPFPRPLKRPQRSRNRSVLCGASVWARIAGRLTANNGGARPHWAVTLEPAPAQGGAPLSQRAGSLCSLQRGTFTIAEWFECVRALRAGRGSAAARARRT